MNENTKTHPAAETMSFEESEIGPKKSRLKRLGAFFKKKLFSIRHAFADSCDKSYLSNQFDNLYFSILNCKLSVLGIYLVVLSVISIILTYLIEPELSYFLTNSNTYSTIVICIIGSVFLTCRKKVSEVLSQSSLFSHLDIVYSQPAIEVSANARKTIIESNSTAFFLGAIAGILSVVLPSTSIALFTLAICYFIFVLARPECGVLFFLFTLPFFSANVSAYISIITFFALLYKYLRGKRHIDIKAMEGTVICAIVYIVLRCSLTGLTSQKLPVLAVFIAFFLIFITTISLVRTTSMLRRSIFVIIALSRVYATICLIFYLCFVLLGKNGTVLYFNNLGLPGLVTAITSREFIIPFLSIVTPLSFANIFIKNNKEVFKSLIYFIVYIALSSFVDSFIFTFILIAFSLFTLVLSMRKSGILIIASPAAAYGLSLLFAMIPSKFRFIADSSNYISINEYLTLLKNNFLFGAGIANPVNASSGVLSLFYVLGIVGILILTALILIVVLKATRSVFSIKEKSIKISTYSHGLLSSAFCFIATSFVFNTLSDFRPAFLFASVLSLAFTSGRCFEEDYVDPNILREQTVHN